MSKVFDKLKQFKALVKVRIPNLADGEITLILDHIKRYQDGIRKELSVKERELYELLLAHKYKVNTVLWWFRALSFPRFLQDQLKEGSLSLTKACEINKEYRLKTDKQLEQEIINDIRNYMDNINLKEFISEELDNVRRKL